MDDNQYKELLSEIFLELKNKFIELGHPLSKHEWRNSNSKSYKQISIVPSEKAEIRGLHYELMLFEDILHIEIHHEKSKKRDEFEELINRLETKFPGKYELVRWNNGMGKNAGYHKLLNKKGIKLSDEERISKLVNVLQETYDDLNNDLDNYYYKIYKPAKSGTSDNTDLYQLIINKYIEILKEYSFHESYKWETVKFFHENWNPETGNINAFIEELFKIQHNIIDHRPKDTFAKFFEVFPDESQQLLIDIFDEEVELPVRYNNFYKKSDELAEKYRVLKSQKRKPTPPREAEFAFFLSCIYPNKYYFYRDNYYQSFASFVGEETKAAGEKYFHYLELMEDFNDNYVKKKDEIIELTSEHLKKQGLSFLENKNILTQNIIFLVNYYYWSKENTTSKNTTMETNHPLNQILYGPPGTGKTYHTINEAVKIVEELSDEEFEQKYRNDRKALKQAFKNYLEETEAHIAFCTFHQSFSYEDFIEGIKPVMSDKKLNITDTTLEKRDCEKGLEYEIQDGIFKKIAQNADSWDKQDEKSKPESFLLSPDEINDAVFYKMSLGNSTKEDDDEIYKYCIDNNKIALGWGGNVDFTEVKDEAALYELAKDEGVEKVPARFVSYLKFALKVSNYVVISKGNTRVRAIAKVTGNYYFDSESEIDYNHFRDVEWIIKDEDIPVKEFYKKSFMQQSLYKLKNLSINPDFFKASEKPVNKIGEEKIRRNHVLIIDEINRGNVSQIFGELITLIEKDKRKGQEEELSVTLPYSKDKFSVPPNLFIVGTMNTADRSIEALDTALRRRFTFKEMPPKSNVIIENGEWEDEPGIIEDVDLVDLLDTMNRRIEKLIDKDHKIGHSYFMSVRSIDDLKNCFKDKIIPLMEEYFYGDFGKIGLVLGDGFVREQDIENDFDFATFKGYDADIVEDFKQRKVYEFSDVETWELETFKSIYTNA